jgi:hypothetical protein
MIARALLAGLVFLIAGCDDSTGPRDPLDGTYPISTWNGSPLPTLITVPGFGDREVTSGRLIFERTTSGDEFQIDWRERLPGSTGLGSLLVVNGGYTVRGNEIRFTSSALDPFNGVISGPSNARRVTVTWPLGTVVFLFDPP